MAKAVSSKDRQFRVALLWNRTILAEEQIAKPCPIGLGDGERFPIPEGVVQGDRLRILEPTGPGYALVLSPAIGGTVFLGGERRDVRSLGTDGAKIPLGPNDYGVLSIGPVAVFFQHVTAARPAPLAGIDLDPVLVACIGLAAFFVGALVLLGLTDLRLNPRNRDPLELNSELITRFLVNPPPPSVEQQARQSGNETRDPGLEAREDTGGRRAEREEGTVGRDDAPDRPTEIAGERSEEIASRVRQVGLLGALSGGGQENAIAQALDVPTVGQILGGMGRTTTIVGRGSGGSGSGGGGTGPGSLFGAGNVGTGQGAGTGGMGRGSGGPGAEGRPRAEVQVRVSAGRPAASGGLSPDQIGRVVRQNASAIKYCYETQVQRRPNMRGQVAIAFRIDPSGSVSTARVASSSLGDSNVEGCVVRVVRRMRFPQADTPSSVTFPFSFGVGG